MALPIALYSTAQVRALDAHAIEALGISGYTLMKRAGEAALRYLRTRWPMAHRIVIVCGGGNNGGDGYVLARFAQAAGLTVTRARGRDPEQLQGDARQAYEDFTRQRRAGARLRRGAPRRGRGDRRCAARHRTARRGARATRARDPRHQRRGRPVFALDVPSGLDGDAGTVARRGGAARMRR